MSSTDLVIFGMCGAMILAGIVIIRISRRDRGIGAIAVALGVVGIVAYLGAEEGAPPPDSATLAGTTIGSPADSRATPLSLTR